MIELISQFDVKSIVIALAGIAFMLLGFIGKSHLKRLEALEQSDKLKDSFATKLHIEQQLQKMSEERKELHKELVETLKLLTLRIEVIALHDLKISKAESEISSLRQASHNHSQMIQRHEGKIEILNSLFGNR